MSNKGTSPLGAHIRLDFRSGLPIYLQIIEQVKQQVMSGALQPGDQLPTVRALAQELRVNFNTIARAYRMLDEAGIISTQQGRGTYILDVPPPEVTESIRKNALEDLTQRYINDAGQLGISPDELIQILKDQVEQRSSTDHPTESQTTVN
jgi:GntR family transcriptional regulator